MADADKLDNIASKIDQLATNLREHAEQDRIAYARIEEWHEKMDTILRGDGEQVAGIIPRVATLERAAESRGKALWAMLLALIGVAGKAVWDALTSWAKSGGGVPKP